MESTIEDLVEYCSSKSELAVDTEGTGLDPHVSKIVTIQIGDLETQFVVDVRSTNKEDINKIK